MDAKHPQDPGLRPSAPPEPPSSTLPSYEEAMAASAGILPRQPENSSPYPVDPALPTTMPMPAPYAQPPNQTAMPPNYGGQNKPVGQSQVHVNANSNLGRPREVLVVPQLLAFPLSPNPIKVTCGACSANIKTITISEYQPSAHISCIVLFFLGCCLCSCLPYCMNTFKTVYHFCPNCKVCIGTWKG